VGGGEREGRSCALKFKVSKVEVHEGQGRMRPE